MLAGAGSQAGNPVVDQRREVGCMDTVDYRSKREGRKSALSMDSGPSSYYLGEVTNFSVDVIGGCKERKIH